MSTTPQTQQNTKLTYRRYKEGDDKFKRSQDNIFQASWTYKCPTYIQSTAPCQGSCPAGEDIRGYLNVVRGIDKPPVGADGKPTMPWQEYAWRRLTDANPFPAIMGRVCPAPCQGGCNRAKVDDFVGINSVEHFLGNYAVEHGLAFPKPEKETGKKIAVIGGGVAGMSCAYHLRRRGHSVVVFESSHKLGGMLTFGLPGYRTPHDVVDAEVQRILDMGVEVRLNTRVGKDVGFADLKKNFDAIFIGIGAQTGNKLDLPGADASNCVDGLSFLRDYNEGKVEHAGKRIIVIGGGDTAMDCAAVARRLGAYDVGAESHDHAKVIVATRECDGGRGQKSGAEFWRQSAEVVIAYRRHVQEMPASKHEIDAVVQEGVEIQPCVAPVSVIKDENGMATALRVIQVDWVNKKMVPKEGSEYDIPADLIVNAVGQSINWAGMEKYKNDRGMANVDKNLMAEPGVFVGGDAIKPFLLTTAIGHGRIAADGIDNYVRGIELDRRPKVDVKQFSLPGKMQEAGAKFETVAEPIRGTDSNKAAGIHNFDDRSPRYVIPAESLFLGHFSYTPRNERDMIDIDANNVLGNAEERLIALTEDKAQAEAKRCMSCGMCFECDNCVMYCPQGAVKKVPKKEATMGRYVYTDYSKCIGCHICYDVCPTGYIQMGLGE
ncbi:MAG: NAD(P)-binding protein [Gammaproteobacteria bacterium]|nr:NAD(P)-binding protein [Gammaproteobacteria bacterium]MBU1415369.1 NAD(P)-binding protein [Gammaproteobacteria bacterium]